MTTFNFAAYAPLALRTEAPLPTAFDRMDHALLGLISETGEFTTEIKRIAVYGKSLDSLAKDGKTTLRQHIAEEIGDTLWYVAIGAAALGNPADLLSYAGVPYAQGPRGQRGLLDSVKSLASAVGQASLAAVDEIGFEDSQEELAGLLGDILQDLNLLANTIGIPLAQIADENIAKLALRYPDKFSAEAAEARADKAGLDARNS